MATDSAQIGIIIAGAALLLTLLLAGFTFALVRKTLSMDTSAADMGDSEGQDETKKTLQKFSPQPQRNELLNSSNLGKFSPTDKHAARAPGGPTVDKGGAAAAVAMAQCSAAPAKIACGQCGNCETSDAEATTDSTGAVVSGFVTYLYGMGESGGSSSGADNSCD